MKKSLDWERCHVRKQERNLFNPKSSGSITPIIALLRSLLADSRQNGLKKGKSICTSFAGTTWTQITLLSTSSYNICVVKLLLPFLQILRGAGFPRDKNKRLLPPIGQRQYRQKWTYSASRARSECLGKSKETVLRLAVKPSDKSWQDSGKSSSPKDSTTNKTIMMITSALWSASPVLRIPGGEHCSRIKMWALETNHQVENPCSATYWMSDPEPVTEPHWASVSSSVKWG